jgi:hypothetical protein
VSGKRQIPINELRKLWEPLSGVPVDNDSNLDGYSMAANVLDANERRIKRPLASTTKSC